MRALRESTSTVSDPTIEEFEIKELEHGLTVVKLLLQTIYNSNVAND